MWFRALPRETRTPTPLMVLPGGGPNQGRKSRLGQSSRNSPSSVVVVVGHPGGAVVVVTVVVVLLLLLLVVVVGEVVTVVVGAGGATALVVVVAGTGPDAGPVPFVLPVGGSAAGPGGAGATGGGAAGGREGVTMVPATPAVAGAGARWCGAAPMSPVAGAAVAGVWAVRSGTTTGIVSRAGTSPRPKRPKFAPTAKAEDEVSRVPRAVTSALFRCIDPPSGPASPRGVVAPHRPP